MQYLQNYELEQIIYRLFATGHLFLYMIGCVIYSKLFLIICLFFIKNPFIFIEIFR